MSQHIPFLYRLFLLATGIFWLMNFNFVPPALAQSEQDAEARFLKGMVQLTFEGKRSGEGYFNRDGTQMVF